MAIFMAFACFHWKSSILKLLMSWQQPWWQGSYPDNHQTIGVSEHPWYEYHVLAASPLVHKHQTSWDVHKRRYHWSCVSWPSACLYSWKVAICTVLLSAYVSSYWCSDFWSQWLPRQTLPCSTAKGPNPNSWRMQTLRKLAIPSSVSVCPVLGPYQDVTIMKRALG